MEGEEIEEEECDAEDDITENLSFTNQMEHCDVLERKEAEIKANSLLKEDMIEEQAEIEVVVMEDMKRQVGKGVEQSLVGEVNEEIFHAEVNEEMFFDEEIQQDDTEPVDKPFKENVSQDMGELSSEEKEGKMEGEQIEKEEDEEEEDPEIVPFITQIENRQRPSQQSKYFQSGTMQQDFYNQEELKPEYYQARIDSSY